MATINLDPSQPHTTWYGIGPPDDSVGKNRDYYQDRATGTMYGPKENGHWPAGLTALAGGTGTPDTLAGTSTGGVTDHGALTGLDDPNDHPWAVTTTELDAVNSALDARLTVVEGSTLLRVYEQVIGDGAASLFGITHNLGRTNLASVRMRDNGTGVNVRGFDYLVVDDDNGSVVFDAYVPTVDQFTVIVTG